MKSPYLCITFSIFLQSLHLCRCIKTNIKVIIKNVCNTKIKTMKKLTKTTILIFIPLLTFSQKLELIGFSPEEATNSVLIILVEELNEKLVSSIEALNRQVGIIKINDISNMTNIADELNDVLNDTTLRINPKKIHLLIIGNIYFFRKCNQISTDLFVTKTYAYTTSNLENSNDFKLINASTIDWKTFIDEISMKQLWEIELNQIQSKHSRLINIDNKLESGIGVHLGNHFPIINTEMYVPNSIFNYGFTHYKQVKNNWYINSSIALGINIPNPRNIIKDAVRSQIDIATIQSGNEIEIDLNEELKGHVYGLGTIGGYYKWSNQKIQPMFGGGISYTFLTSFQRFLDTTFTIDPSTITQGNVSSTFTSNNGFDELDRNRFNGTGIYTTAGFQYQFHPLFTFQLQGQYNFNFTENSFQNIGISAGFSIRFKGEQKTIYEYFRINN